MEYLNGIAYEKSPKGGVWCLMSFRVEKNQALTLSRFQELTTKIENRKGKKPLSISIKDKSKEFSYDVKENCLTIFNHNVPYYQNNNGIVCRDDGALADSM